MTQPTVGITALEPGDGAGGTFWPEPCAVLAGYRRTSGPTEDFPTDEQTKGEIWDLAAGTFIAVSVVSSLAYMIVSAI